MHFAVEIKVPTRRSERIAKRLGDRAPKHRPTHARKIFIRRGLERQWRQFLPNIWRRERGPDASSRMKMVYGLVWADEREEGEAVPVMRDYHQIDGLPPTEQLMRFNRKFKSRCQGRHEDLAYLGRDNADLVLCALRQQFQWAPWFESWEWEAWRLTPEERQRRDRREEQEGDLVFEPRIKK